MPLLRDLSALKKVGLDYYGPKFVIKNIDGSEPDTKCMRIQQYWPADADLRRQLPGVEVEVSEWQVGCITLPLGVRARCQRCHAGQGRD
jgi:hypothetical protein